MLLLEQTEREYITKVLLERLRGYTYFIDTVSNENYRIALESRPDILSQVKHALNLALTNNGQLYDPALTDILGDLSPTDTTIADILTKVNARLANFAVVAPPAAAGHDCFQDLDLIYGNPFLNRTLLRNRLRQVMTPLGNPFFLINGDKGTGKSYTQKLIDHCSIVAGNYVAAAIMPPLMPEQGGEQMPEILAQEIISAMSLTPDLATLPVRDENKQTQEQYAKLLAPWLLRHIKQDDPNFYCIMLDGYDCDELNDWTRTFLKTFAAKILSGHYRQKVRLVLINHSTKNLEALDGYYDEEIIEPVTRGDVRTYLETKLTRDNIAHIDADLTLMIDRLLGSTGNDADKLSPQQLKDVNKALKGMK